MKKVLVILLALVSTSSFASSRKASSLSLQTGVYISEWSPCKLTLIMVGKKVIAQVSQKGESGVWANTPNTCRDSRKTFSYIKLPKESETYKTTTAGSSNFMKVLDGQTVMLSTLQETLDYKALIFIKQNSCIQQSL